MDAGERNRSAPVIWLTGLSGAGKSTIAMGLETALRSVSLPVVVLDGDEMRRTLCQGLGFVPRDREENVRRIGVVAELLARSGITPIVAAISPYRAGRDAVRERVSIFVEVYVRCPLEVLEARDTKGLYARARTGALTHMTGVDDPYEAPLEPALVLDTASEPPTASVERVLSHLENVFPDLPKPHPR